MTNMVYFAFFWARHKALVNPQPPKTEIFDHAVCKQTAAKALRNLRCFAASGFRRGIRFERALLAAHLLSFGKSLEHNMVKPHDRLVLLGSRVNPAYTYSLSTW